MNCIVERIDPVTGEVLNGLPHPIHHDLDGNQVFLADQDRDLLNSVIASLLRQKLISGVFVVKHGLQVPADVPSHYVEVFHARAPSIPKPLRSSIGTLVETPDRAQAVPARKRRPPSAFEIWTKGLNRLSGAPKGRELE